MNGNGKEQTIWLIVFSVVLIIAGLIVSALAPCGCYGCSPIQDVPSRCLKEFVK